MISGVWSVGEQENGTPGRSTMGDGEVIIDLIRESVKPGPHPAVFLSGGLDSTILLHHLNEKTEEEIHTYTAYWLDYDKNEIRFAKMVSEHYNTVHHEVKMKGLISLYEKIIPQLDRPRFNLWPTFLYRAAFDDLRETVYTGEGMDEHFGGYWYREEQTYQENWSVVLEYSLPTHRQLAKRYDLRLETPFVRLPVEMTLPYYDKKNHNKELLRLIYQNIIPRHVIERKKQPGRTPWLHIWHTEIEPFIGIKVPDTRQQAQDIMRKWVTKQWLFAQS